VITKPERDELRREYADTQGFVINTAKFIALLDALDAAEARIAELERQIDLYQTGKNPETGSDDNVTRPLP
jgi:transposase